MFFIQEFVWYHNIVRLEKSFVLNIVYLGNSVLSIILYVGFGKACRFNRKQYGTMVYVGYSVECRHLEKQYAY